MNLLIAGLLILSTACSNSDDTPEPAPSPVPGGGPSGGVESVTPIRSDLSVDLNTDKACYAPGEAVRFTASDVPAGARIRYRNGAEVVKDEPPLPHGHGHPPGPISPATWLKCTVRNRTTARPFSEP